MVFGGGGSGGNLRGAACEALSFGIVEAVCWFGWTFQGWDYPRSRPFEIAEDVEDMLVPSARVGDWASISLQIEEAPWSFSPLI